MSASQNPIGNEGLARLQEEVLAELGSAQFAGLRHYSRATYSRGCTGPLCRLAETHRGRLRNEQRAVASGREYKPYFDRRGVAGEWYLMEVVERLGWAKKAS